MAAAPERSVAAMLRSQIAILPLIGLTTPCAQATNRLGMVSRLHLVVVCAIVFSVLPGQRSEAAPAGARIGPTGVPTGAPPGSPATAQATPTQRRAREPKSDGGPDLPVALGFKLKAVREPEARPKQTAAARPEKKKGIT